MSGVFRNVDPPPSHRLASVYPPPPPPLVRGEDTLAGWRGGGGVNCSEDARHYSVLYICKYFVDLGQQPIFSQQYTIHSRIMCSCFLQMVRNSLKKM
jgi:hypothetical protein